MRLFEYEVWLSTHDALRAGIVDLDRRKYLVAAVDDWEGYQVAVDMAWRDDRPGPAFAVWAHDPWQVTQVWLVL